MSCRFLYRVSITFERAVGDGQRVQVLGVLVHLFEALVVVVRLVPGDGREGSDLGVEFRHDLGAGDVFDEAGGQLLFWDALFMMSASEAIHVARVSSSRLG